MYNEKQKQRYIKIEGSTNRQHADCLTNYFERIGKIESKPIIDKDIADMNFEELKYTFSSLGICSEKSMGQIIGMIRPYIKWVHLKGLNKLPVGGEVDKLNTENVDYTDAIRRQMFRDFEHLIEVIDKANDLGYYSSDTRKLYERLLFVLLYIGIGIEELRSLRKDDLNTTSKEIRVGERSYMVDDSLLADWVEYSNLKETESSSVRGIAKRQLKDTEFLFRNIVSENSQDQVGMSKIRGDILKVFKKYTENTNIDLIVASENFKKSGIFYRALLDEKQCIEINREYMAEKFRINYKNHNDLTAKTRSLVIDYQNWKKAFGY